MLRAFPTPPPSVMPGLTAGDQVQRSPIVTRHGLTLNGQKMVPDTVARVTEDPLYYRATALIT